MLVFLSWKNVWRNKVRSLIITCAIAIGVVGGVSFIAFWNGMINQRLAIAIGNEVSNIQIHNPKYIDNKTIEDTIPNVTNLTKYLDTCRKVKGYASRIKVVSMINSANNSSGIMVHGIHPEQEKKISGIYKYIIEGDYFSNSRKNSIVVGKKLADKLKIKLKSKVVITMQSVNGDITSAAFKVTGIYKTDNTSFDERAVFVKIADIAGITGLLEQNVHEIGISLYSDEDNKQVVEAINQTHNGALARSWKTIMPELAMMTESSKYMLYIFMTIIFLALSFGIINTMLMAVLERINEIGMLMAIGMNKVRIFGMIMTETIMLMFTGSCIGLIVSYFLVMFFGKYGIDLSVFASGLEDMGFSAIVFPVMETASYFTILILVFITGILSSIIPARKALSLNPATAIRKN